MHYPLYPTFSHNATLLSRNAPHQGLLTALLRWFRVGAGLWGPWQPVQGQQLTVQEAVQAALLGGTLQNVSRSVRPVCVWVTCGG
jgi:hypothetical protein